MGVNLGTTRDNLDATHHRELAQTARAVNNLRTLVNAGIGYTRTSLKVATVGATDGVVRVDTGAKAIADTSKVTTYDDGPIGISIGAGLVCVSGHVHWSTPVIDTNSSSPTALLPYTAYYLSSVQNGTVTEVPPVSVGKGTTKSDTIFNRVVFYHQVGNVVYLPGPVSAINAPCIDYLPNVKITTPNPGDLLVRDPTNKFWYNTPSTAGSLPIGIANDFLRYVGGAWANYSLGDIITTKDYQDPLAVQIQIGFAALHPTPLAIGSRLIIGNITDTPPAQTNGSFLDFQYEGSEVATDAHYLRMQYGTQNAHNTVQWKDTGAYNGVVLEFYPKNSSDGFLSTGAAAFNFQVGVAFSQGLPPVVGAADYKTMIIGADANSNIGMGRWSPTSAAWKIAMGWVPTTTGVDDLGTFFAGTLYMQGKTISGKSIESGLTTSGSECRLTLNYAGTPGFPCALYLAGGATPVLYDAVYDAGQGSWGSGGFASPYRDLNMTVCAGFNGGLGTEGLALGIPSAQTYIGLYGVHVASGAAYPGLWFIYNSASTRYDISMGGHLVMAVNGGSSTIGSGPDAHVTFDIDMNGAALSANPILFNRPIHSYKAVSADLGFVANGIAGITTTFKDYLGVVHNVTNGLITS